MLKIKQNFRKLIDSFRKSKIKVVYEDDLIEMLKSMGVFKKIEKGEFSCVYCGEIINIKNIEVLFSKHGEIKFVCTKLTCISKL